MAILVSLAILSLPLLKGEELLSYVVDKHKQTRTYQHGDILNDSLAEVHTLQSIACQGQCQTIGYQVAHHDVQCKLHDASPVSALIVEREMFVQDLPNNCSQRRCKAQT